MLFFPLLVVLTACSAFAQEHPFTAYTVKAGDTVQSLATRFGIEPANLAAANGLAEADILPSSGTVLLVPKSSGDVLATLYEAKRRGLGAWPKPRYADEFLTPLTGEALKEEAAPVSSQTSLPKIEAQESPFAAPEKPGDAAEGGKTPAAERGSTHTVREGDTLYRISRHYGISLTSLLLANSLTETSVIKIGETLRIPDAAGRQDPAPEVRNDPPEKETPAEQKPEAGPEQAPALRLTWPLRGGTPPRATGTSFGEGLSVKTRAGEPVHAAADATVLHGGWMRNFGNAVYLNHGEGMATFYGGLGILYVKAGEKVKRGSRIALVGDGGGTEPRLFFHLLREGKSVDPTPWLEGGHK